MNVSENAMRCLKYYEFPVFSGLFSPKSMILPEKERTLLFSKMT